ncbi:MAG: DNA repair protein RecN (Recombination protein N) [Planctomycetota bacterium]
MLKSLEIKNYAIIEHITIVFDEKLNIITGETGAGKSILLGALGLTLGERADSKALYNKDNKCFVEAIFTLKPRKFKPFFKENDLDFEESTSIRREIAVSGKSRAFINDTPVTLSILKALTEQLVNLHSQQETGELNKQGFQIAVVDFSAKNQNLLEEYKKELIVLRKLRKTLKEALEKTALLQQDYDFNLFQLNEIIEANLGVENLENLESELAILCNAEEIKTTLWEMVSGIDNEDVSVLSILNELSTKLSKIADYSADLTSLSERLESVLVEVVDLKSESEIQAGNTDLDEERIQELTEKVNIGNKLLQKHHLNSIEELNEFKETLQEKTASVADISSLTEKLELGISNQEKVLDEIAKGLSDARKKVIPGIEKTLSKTLQKIGMPNAKFVVELSKKDVFDAFGKDDIKFLFSSNKGFEPQELTKIASGGELSRVMLSIKSLLAGSTDLPTLIFDEIDTGISGEVASKVGDVFKEIAKKHQLISITHLPQIASKADKHFFIYKEDNSEKTKTKIASLTPEQHVKAIARMLSGNKITDASLENAKLLIG